MFVQFCFGSDVVEVDEIQLGSAAWRFSEIS